VNETISRRHLFRREYRPVKSAVARIIARADPVNLLALGAPGDEYDGEVAAILPLLASAQSVQDVHSILRAEFVRRFGEEVAGSPARYDEAAAAIWQVLTEQRRGRRS
jgi:hypothetical protein